MYRKQKRIPTPLALFILLTGLAFSLYLDRSNNTLFIQASKVPIPEEIHVSNVSDNSFAISWLSSSPVAGSVQVNYSGKKMTYLDDLDSDNIPRPRNTHYVTIKNLPEKSVVEAKIIQGSSCREEISCPTLNVRTGPKIPPTNMLLPIKGYINRPNNQPVPEAIVYVSVGKSMLLSGRSDSSGLWVIPFSNLRTQDLLEKFVLGDNDLINISIKASPLELSSAVTDVKSIRLNLELPPMVIGNSYNYVDLITKKDMLSQDPNNRILGTSTEISGSTALPTPGNTGDIELVFPKSENQTTSDQQPRIKGVGKPGTELMITVNSTPQTAKVKVGKDGTWSYRPTQKLPPGIHTISVQGYDALGKLFSLKRKFIVLKSGEQVLGDATPSASLTPSPSVTVLPSIVPSISPLPSPTIPAASLTPTVNQQIPTIIPISPEVPRSGNERITWILGFTSICLVALGYRLLRL